LEEEGCRGQERRGGAMGSFARLARRAVETDAPVMVKVTNFSCLIEFAS
jgi:hypothetical protein